MACDRGVCVCVSDYDDIRGFLSGGYEDMGNTEGPLSSLVQINTDLDNFGAGFVFASDFHVCVCMSVLSLCLCMCVISVCVCVCVCRSVCVFL